LLFDEKLLSEQAFEASRERHESSMKDHELARNSIERSEKELDLSSERLLRTRISAPFDCTVLTRPVSIGQAVSGSGGFNSGTEVLTIADLSSMVINAHVNQADVTRLKHGMEVLVEVDAVPGLKVSGEIERIAPQAIVKNMIKGYATRIALKNVDARIQPGMTASISIPVSAADNVLTVPLAAVFSEQGERYVYVKNGESTEKRTVMVGVSDFFRAEIKSGLNDGDVVSLEPPGGTAARVPGGGPALAQGGSRPASHGTGTTSPATASASASASATPKPATANAATGSATPASPATRPGTTPPPGT
jgi:RND family efflux transporter MFP subunit